MLDREAAPVKIGRLQRHATDHVYDNGTQLFNPPTRKSGKRVAIVGGGPAGLGCAAELAQLGHQAVIFEKKPQAGGLNTYGIAYYRSEEHTSELQSRFDLVCRLLLEKKKKYCSPLLFLFPFDLPLIILAIS